MPKEDKQPVLSMPQIRLSPGPTLPPSSTLSRTGEKPSSLFSPTSTAILPKEILLEQAHALLNTVCPSQVTERAELRHGFLKQLAEYKQTSPTVPLTIQQEHELQELIQTLREIQAGAPQITISRMTN